MKVVFRVDASDKIATGHVHRCLSLARALSAKGVSCLFIHRAHVGNMAKPIRDAGFSVHELAAPVEGRSLAQDDVCNGYLGVAQQEDVKETYPILEKLEPDLLVADHYAIDSTWENAIKGVAGRIVVIDDLADRQHDCEILVDQNLTNAPAERYRNLVPSECTLLLGPRFAILRPEFAQLPPRQSVSARGVTRVFIFYGGSDRTNETARALRVLSKGRLRELCVDVVVGRNHPDPNGIRALAERRGRTHVHGPREHLADLMSHADIALGAGGTTTWERCAAGLPSIVTAIGPDQVAVSQTLAEHGLTYFVGAAEEITDRAVERAIVRCLDDVDSLDRVAWRLQTMTDGLGARRVAETIQPSAASELSLRPARIGDVSHLFEWVNELTTRRFSHSTQEISWSEHIDWFSARLNDSRSYLWVLETQYGLPVGQIRTEVKEGEAIIDYSIDPVYRGRGWGLVAITLLLTEWSRVGEGVPLVAEVYTYNTASVRTLERTGFTLMAEHGKLRRYCWTAPHL